MTKSTNGEVYVPHGKAYKKAGKYWFRHWDMDICWTDERIPSIEITAEEYEELKRK